MKKRIFVCTVALILAFTIPITAVAVEVTPYEYWEAVSNNTFLYYKTGYEKTYYDETFGFISYLDVPSMSYGALENLVTNSSQNIDFSSTVLPNGAYATCAYQWWIPLNTVSGAVDIDYYAVNIVIANHANGYSVDGTMVYFNTYGELITVDNRLSVYGYTSPSINDPAEKVSLTGYTLSSANYTSVFPTSECWGFSKNCTYRTLVIPADLLTEIYYLSIRWNCQGTLTTTDNGYGRVSPFVAFCVSPLTIDNTTISGDPFDTDSSGGVETDPVESGESETLSTEDKILVGVESLGDQLAQMLEPSEENQNRVDQEESELESRRDEFDAAQSKMDEIVLPEVDGILDILNGNKDEFDPNWLNASFGGLWGNKFILTIMVTATVFAFFGFVLYGKRG